MKDSTSNIYTKLLEFQKLGISLKKDSKGAFKNGYASMNEVLDKVIEPLNKLGILVAQSPTVKGGVYGLYTKLLDTDSGTYIISFTPFINSTDMQKLGGAITYARRYALVSMFALEAEDDDGETAVGRNDTQKSVKTASTNNNDFTI